MSDTLEDGYMAVDLTHSKEAITPGSPPPVAIGDLQGCAGAFERLLAVIDADDHLRIASGLSTAPSPLWLAGDLVNRGPASLTTLRLLMQMEDRITTVLGNHDLHLLAVAAGVRSVKKGDTITEILDAADATTMLDWLRHRPLAHFSRDILLVHAGVLPQWDVAQTLALAAEVESGLRGKNWHGFIRQLFGSDGSVWRDDLAGELRLRVISNALTRLRFCTPDGAMEWKSNGGLDSAAPGFVPWFDAPGRRTANHLVVFGHWAALGLMRRDNVIGLDSGCVWGNALSAVRLAKAPQDRTLFQVSCADIQTAAMLKRSAAAVAGLPSQQASGRHTAPNLPGNAPGSQ